MGWNSWNHFDEKVTDADVRATADALVSSGMRDAGYIYVNVDTTPGRGSAMQPEISAPTANFLT